MERLADYARDAVDAGRRGDRLFLQRACARSRQLAGWLAGGRASRRDEVGMVDGGATGRTRIRQKKIIAEKSSVYLQYKLRSERELDR